MLPFLALRRAQRAAKFLAPSLFCFLASSAAMAQTQRACPSYVEPQIMIQPMYPAELYNDRLDLIDIQRIAGQANVETAGARDVLVGLTASNLRFDLSFDAQTYAWSDQSDVCAQVARLSVTFGFEDATVYLAREIPFHSCGYYEVLNHERHHLAIDREIVTNDQPLVQARFAEKLREIGMIRTYSAIAAQQQLSQTLKAFLKDVGLEISQQRQRQQQAFDSPEEYRRLSLVCDGELAALIRKTRMGSR